MQGDNSDTAFFSWRRDPLWKTAGKAVGMFILSPFVLAYFGWVWVQESGPDLFWYILRTAAELLSRVSHFIWTICTTVLSTCWNLLSSVTKAIWEPIKEHIWKLLSKLISVLWSLLEVVC